MSGTERDNGGSRGARRLWPLFLGLPLIALLAVGAILLSGRGEEQASQPASDDRQQDSGDRGRTAKLGTPSRGSAEAPVVLTEYSDYQ